MPPPAPATLADVPPPFLQRPREVVDIMKGLCDWARRQTEDTGRIAACVRIMREEAKRQSALPAAIEREQAIENRTHGRDAHASPSARFPPPPTSNRPRPAP
ncbi:hypothetical protein FPV16_24505 [Methylobacterium sp. W2]|uniref:hypothetical protein n=1 Tax=Methylobacterium sp. W2 TaxID=2598107 RepID=UPI001D0CC235|nr:hypothetical protein [Methylobacterium sp. W2]MCC0809320.1 hypothetical protein [Methylobacterium sp. W2]